MIDYIRIPDGHSHPLGATCYSEGVNFSVFSKNAEKVELLLFNHPDDAEPSHVFELDPERNRTFYYWHIFVPGLKSGQLYGFKVYGPYDPENGHLYDSSKLLIDPYARSIVMNGHYSRLAAIGKEDNLAKAMKSVVINPTEFDWEDDSPIQRPYSETVIYEMHVGGFTKHPSSGVEEGCRGKYRGVIEKIPYLRDLGITAVELMPVQQFDPQDARPSLTNYWGYSPIAFFAPHNGYSCCKDPQESVNEFREMVKKLHQAGIEVILDVVFNHTAEAGVDGPTFSFRGLENKAYYILGQEKSAYLDYTGCGNTLNANHSIVRRMIMDCLRSWVTEFHVDGFRFDLASVLSRDENGEPLKNPPVLWEIESDPVLSGTKIIAEAWDAAGLYQVGSFIGDRWAEWNGKYRDHVRRFIKGDDGMVSKFAAKLIASPDIYTNPNRQANRSIHFVTCHDGLTLNDLVSYNQKHNTDNLENNRDGSDHNFSWNCGVEGETDDPEIKKVRTRQIKNFLVITFISQGTPMILMGDEVRRTQKGNNNAYCQDNDISWFDWALLERNSDIYRFTQRLISFAQNHELFKLDNILATPRESRLPHIKWHGIKVNEPDWSEHSHTLSFTLKHPDYDEYIHAMVNTFWEDLNFEIPDLHQGWAWAQIINTYASAPKDFLDLKEATPVKSKQIKVKNRSIIVLIGIKLRAS